MKAESTSPRISLPPPGSTPDTRPGKGREGSAYPEPADRLEFSANVGESGAPTLRSSGVQHSFLNLFRFEGIHAAAHRALAAAGGRNIRFQDIRIKSAITPEGDLIAVSGATETRIADITPAQPAPSPDSTPALGAGGDDLLRELAFASDLHRFLIGNGSAAFGMTRRPMPSIAHAGSVGSARRVMQNRADLRARTDRDDLLSFLHSLSEQELRSLLDALEPVERAIGNLRSTLDNLEADGAALTALETSGGEPAARAAVISARAEPGRHELSVKRLATAHTVEASYYAPDHPALADLLDTSFQPLLDGSEFTVELNGVAVAVQSSASLPDLVDRINHGEDLNRNDRFDTADDYLAEEDANANGTFDGGTREHGVVASIHGGHLRLAMAEAGTGALQVRDPDGLLTALGMMELDSRGLQVFSNELSPAAGSRFTLNSTPYERPTNRVDDIIPGVAITLEQAGGEPVRIDVLQAPDVIEQQVNELVSAYNSAIRSLNGTLASTFGGLLKNEEHVQRAYLDLRYAAEAPVRGQPEHLDRLASAGVRNTGRRGVRFHSQQLDAARTRRETGERTNPLQQAQTPPGIFNALDEVGIVSEEDNTLVIDKARLRDVTEADPVALRDLFRREPGGILGRLAKAARLATDPNNGHLRLARGRAGALGGSRLGQAARQSLLVAEQARQQALLLGGTFSPPALTPATLGAGLSALA